MLSSLDAELPPNVNPADRFAHDDLRGRCSFRMKELDVFYLFEALVEGLRARDSK